MKKWEDVAWILLHVLYVQNRKMIVQSLAASKTKFDQEDMMRPNRKWLGMSSLCSAIVLV